MIWSIVLIAVLGVLAEAASAASLTPLGFLAGDTTSYAFSVSAHGSVVVGSSQTSAPYNQAFRWTATGGIVGLGYLPGASISSASGVSADGSVVVGGSQSFSGNGQAFRWTGASGMVGLGSLPSGFSSFATVSAVMARSSSEPLPPRPAITRLSAGLPPRAWWGWGTCPAAT